jgi:TBC1 domain family protein 5
LTKKIKDKYSSYFKFKDILSKEDYEFLDIIKVDVTRTFQKVELFKQEKIQQILINILYIFAKKNKDIGYRQGMSDLCAIFLYVIYKQKFLDPSFIEDKNTFLFYLLYSNNEFLEHDTYSLFSRFMLKGYMHFFLYNDEKYLNGDLSKVDNEKKKLLKKDEIKNSNDSELKKRIYLVYYHEFPLVDKQLYQFMVDKIEPEVFIVRWFICAFSREFTLPQLLELWDLILLEQFLVDKNSKKKDESNHYYKFVDYIVLSMLINIKNLIMLKKTNSELMSFLMKYPKNIEAKNIYMKALEIYNKNEKSIKI